MALQHYLYFYQRSDQNINPPNKPAVTPMSGFNPQLRNIPTLTNNRQTQNLQIRGDDCKASSDRLIRIGSSHKLKFSNIQLNLIYK